MHRHRKGSLDRRQRGMAMVELALILPVLVLLLLGTMETGWMFFRMHQLSSISREAARLAIRPDATDGMVTARVDELMSDFKFTTYDVAISPPGIEDLEAGEPIEVSIEVPYSAAGLLSTNMVSLPGTLRSRATMAKEGVYLSS